MADPQPSSYPAIDRIRGKLSELAALEPHRDHRVRRCLGEPAVRGLAALFGVALPEDYVAFVLGVGNGGAGPTAYPLVRLAEALVHSRPARPFRLEGPAVWASDEPQAGDVAWLLARELADGAAREVVHVLPRDLPEWTEDDGSMPIGTHGCGLDAVLVLTGPRRGEVWLRGDAGLVRIGRSFLAWYEAWLDERIAAATRFREDAPTRTAELVASGDPAPLFEHGVEIARITGDHRAADAVLAQALALGHPLSAYAAHWICQVKRGLGAHDAVIELAERLEREGRAAAVDAWITAHAYMRRQDTARAIAWLDRACDRQPERYSRELARIYLWSDRHAECLARTTATADPDAEPDHALELLRGAARAGLSGDLEAMRELRALSEADPEVIANAVREIHDYLERRGQLIERWLVRADRWALDAAGLAIREIDGDGLLACERAAALDDHGPLLRADPGCSSLRCARARAWLALGAPGEAVSELAWIPEDSAERCNLLACAYAACGRYAEAIAEAERGLARWPSWHVLEDNLGGFAASAGDPVRAIELHARVIAAQPDYAWAHQHMAIALTRLGRAEDALGYLGSALALGYERWRIASDPGLAELQHRADYAALMSQPANEPANEA